MSLRMPDVGSVEYKMLITEVVMLGLAFTAIVIKAALEVAQ